MTTNDHNNPKRRCVRILLGQHVPGRGYVPSMVTEGEAGHSPLVGSGELSEPWYWGDDYDSACKIAADFNRRLGLSDDDVETIVASSITAQFHAEASQREVDHKLGRDVR
jgi:hypothetical protein